MRFSLAAALVMLGASSTIATLPSTCTLDEFYPEAGTIGPTYTCRWWVCTGNSAWREVRNCGTGNSCWVGHPTTCVDHVGGHF
ncbi:hypothetical protein B0T25DRAFT_578902 [Lasiosphaeria hispida]|uniref:Uncharacterized protein n=1 Tax=Lasiosphaeria hispida TaxID=260671 RepID=A0AAJ0MFR3_9PEZI|nr:hypothetical protein B0T25DRAFT_578902 [Lasiosphaeria hispida]